jgi:hypothetical protein
LSGKPSPRAIRNLTISKRPTICEPCVYARIASRW